MKRIAVLLALMSFGMAASAQNVIRNPAFDVDASGWELSMYTAWSNRVDHEDSPYSGALQITTRTVDTGSQCVDLTAGETYAVSMWVEKDPQSSVEPCSKPSSGYTLEIFDAQQCTGPVTSTLFTARRIPEPDGWQHFFTSFSTSETNRSARLTLSGECNSNGTGIAIHYYDDVSIAPDGIFKGDFEIQNL